MKNKKLPKSLKFVVGIDEVGRGPLAGPIAICAFKMPVNFNARKFGKIKDSKQLTAENRKAIFGLLHDLKKEKHIDYFVSYESAKRIDTIGLSKTIKNCLEKCLKNLKIKPHECIILLDGGLKAPAHFKNQKTIIKGDEKKFGTVGAVALDINGDLCAATSTGGMTNKKFGRVGDSPIIGAGTYANNKTCAISCTGHGELFIRSVVAYDISCLMEYKNLSLAEACHEVVMKKLVAIQGEGGLIAIDHLGNIEMPFNSEGMYRAMKNSDTELIAIYK